MLGIITPRTERGKQRAYVLDAVAMNATSKTAPISMAMLWLTSRVRIRAAISLNLAAYSSGE